MNTLYDQMEPMWVALQRDFSNYWSTVPQTYVRKFRQQDFSSFSSVVMPPIRSVLYDFNWTQFDTLVVISSALGIFFLRVLLVKYLFKNVAHQLHLREADRVKMPESLWNMLFYGCTFSYAYYLINITGRHRYLENPHNCWAPMTPQQSTEVWILYMVELGYYISAILMDLVFNTEKDDYWMMQIHHFATINLIGFSYAMGIQAGGVLVLYCHDLCDVLLDLAYMRFWKFGLYTLYATGPIMAEDTDGSFWLIFNTLLHTLLVLHYIWFYFICRVVKKVIFDGVKEDVREHDADAYLEEKKHPHLTADRRRSSLAQEFDEVQKGTDNKKGSGIDTKKEL